MDNVHWYINGNYNYADPSHAKGFNVSYHQTSGNSSQLEEFQQYHCSTGSSFQQQYSHIYISHITRANVNNQPAHQEGTLIVA